MSKTKIEWTEATWNPVTGCDPVSPGCDHCYAARMAKRLAGRCGYPAAPHQFDVTLHPDRLLEPLSWRKPRMVFVNSMSDTFHRDVPDEYLYRMFAVMAACPQHTFQVLTKRPERMAEYLRLVETAPKVLSPYGKPTLPDPLYKATVWLLDEMGLEYASEGGADILLDRPDFPWPLPNVWLGVTAEDQQRANERIPLLLQCPAAVRFVSVEPMLGPVEMTKLLTCQKCDCDGREVAGHDMWGNNFTGWCSTCGGSKRLLNWVICGGETGPGARPMHPDWARSLRDQCAAAGVPFFFKQWGDWLPKDQIAEWDAFAAKYPRMRGRFIGKDGQTIAPELRLAMRPLPVIRVGKARAGHLLDGVEHREFPGVK